MFKSLKRLFNLNKILQSSEDNEDSPNKDSINTSPINHNAYTGDPYRTHSNFDIINEIQQRISKLATTLVRDVMVPRTDVHMLALDSDEQEIVEFMKKNLYSRIPIYDKSIDDIVGVLYSKDLTPYLLSQQNQTTLDIRKFLRPALFIPESERLLDILKEFREKNIHLGIVVDEYGGFSGIATLGNILEEIVGDIPDEQQEEQEELIQKINHNEYRVQAGTDIEDLNEALSIAIPMEENETIGGFVFDLFGHVPKKLAVVEYKHIQFQVLKVQRNRITEIKMKIHPKLKLTKKREDKVASSNFIATLWTL